MNVILMVACVVVLLLATSMILIVGDRLILALH